MVSEPDTRGFHSCTVDEDGYCDECGMLWPPAPAIDQEGEG